MSADEHFKLVRVSIVVPVYSGAAYLRDLVMSIGKVRDTWVNDSAPIHIEEVIFVDDDAIDDSASELDKLASAYPWIRVLHLSRNFGQHPATIAGILYTSGDWVVTLDEDLQHLPENIPAMLQLAVTRQLDIVYAHAVEGVHESGLRDLGSRLSKGLTGILAGDMGVLKFSSFRVIRGAIARSASSVCAHETYFDIALSWFTSRVGTLSMQIKDQRYIGDKKSGYTLRKLLSHARRLVMSSRLKALRIGGYIGVMALLLGFAMAAYVAFSEFFSPGIFGARGWSSLIVTTLVFGGMTLFLLSATLEYLSILVLRAQGKPTFFVIDRSDDAEIVTYLKESGT